jgi:predicted metal-dependent hydrolase
MPDGSRPIRVRKLDFDFGSVPRRWFFESTFASHVANGVNMLFPEGERFFIRAVKHYLDRIDDDPELLARVRGFFGQEGSHGHAHEKAFQLLRAQGYEIDDWLKWYRKVAYERLAPRFPPVIQLSVTVALEHFTATMAEHALASDMLDHAHPTMRTLLRWHACEEIEHKAVAFDVLRRVDPRWSVRVAGLAIATVALLGFWRLATRNLVRQDLAAGRVTKAELDREQKDARARGQDFTFVRRAILAYLRPSFHPDDHDDYALARDWLSAQGRLEG